MAFNNAASVSNNTSRYFGNQPDQLLECFNDRNGHGSSFKIEYPIKDFWNYGWDNKFSSCCFTGFWFLYEYNDYNRYHPNVIFFSCVKQTKNSKVKLYKQPWS